MIPAGYEKNGRSLRSTEVLVIRLLRPCSDEPDAFAKARIRSTTNHPQSAGMRPNPESSALIKVSDRTERHLFLALVVAVGVGVLIGRAARPRPSGFCQRDQH